MQQSHIVKLVIGALAVGFFGIGGYILFSKKTDTAIVTSPNGDVVARSFSESPDLKLKVDAGELKPANERLPKVPLVLVPVEKIGTYGGTWHVVAKSKSDHNSILRIIGYENLVRWNVHWTDIIPNVVQSFDVNENATEYVFRLREGMKWSDGEPFTVDDILFWYDDVFLNKDLMPTYQDWMMSGGKPAVVSKVDESTVKFSFSAPHALFLQALAHPRGGEMVAYPRHYLKQFIPKYNPNIDSLVKSEGVKDWVALFKSKYGTPGTLDDQTRWQHPEVPTLNPWIMIDTYGKSPIVKAVRNPYYWKIDPAGNQLPYIDMIEFTIEDDAKKITEMAVSGKLDMQDRHVGNSMLTLTESRPLIEANQTQGGYHLFKTVFATMNTMILSFNLNHKDPVLKEIFNNKDFRVGLSYAIDRQKIIKTMFDGRGSPYQAAPRPESPFYDKEMAEQYTEYSVAKANDHLDKAGISKKDSVGYRLRPDGKRLSFTVDWGDPKTLGMIQADWKAVGIDMKIGNTSDRTAYYTKKNNKDTDVSVWTGDGGIDVIQEPRYYFPFNDESNYAIGWAYWFFAPQNKLAEEPPQITKDQMALYRKLSETPDTEKQNEYMKEILKMAKDQFYVIGISLPVDGFGVVKNTFRNVPEAMPAGYVYPNPAPTNPPQYFIEK